MSELNRRMSRRELLRITIPGVSLILGGCGELSVSAKQRKQQKLQRRAALQGREVRRKMLKKVRNGYEGTSPAKNTSTRTRNPLK
jgi:hypothetical protein